MKCGMIMCIKNKRNYLFRRLYSIKIEPSVIFIKKKHATYEQTDDPVSVIF